MLEKVLVMEVKQDYAIAMKPSGEMVRIRRKDGMQAGDKIYILPEDLYRKQTASKIIPFQKNTHRLIRNLASVAAVLVLIIGLVLYSGPATVYAVASFDGRQDLQLKLDSSYRILSGSSSRISEEEIQQLQGQKLSDVGEQLCRLVGDGPVLIGYASYNSNTDSDAKAEQQLREMFSDRIILCLLGNGEDIKQADESMESLGFYLAGEVIADHHIEDLDDLLEDFAERHASEDQHDDDKDDDYSHLNDMDLEQLLDEIHQNPKYEGDENVLEILADKIEELHEEHKENDRDSEDEDSNDTEEDTQDEDEDSDSDSSQTEADDEEDNEQNHDSETDDEEEDSD